MAGYWLKLYTEIIDDPKYHKLSDNGKLGMIELMIIAKKVDKGGYIPPIDELNFYTRRTDGWWAPVIQELIEIQFLVDTDNSLVIRKFEERQAPVSGPDRARFSRELKNTSKIEPKYKPNKYDEICNPLPNAPGVYFIHFPERNIGYIGASKNIAKRVRAHLSEMNDSRHGLYEAYSDVGLGGLKVDVLAQTDDLSQLAKLEIDQIKEHESAYVLVNTDGFKPNRHWKSAYESYGDRVREDTELDTETETEKEVDVEVNCDTPLVSPIQRMLEKVTGLMPANANDIKALDEIESMHPIQADVQAGADWLKGQGKVIRYYSSLVGPIRTAVAARVQSRQTVPRNSTASIQERNKQAIENVLREAKNGNT